MSHVKQYILYQSATAGSAQLFENDKDNWLWLTWFFCQFHTLSEQWRITHEAPKAASGANESAAGAPFNVSTIATSIDLDTFAFLSTQIESYLEAPAAHKKTSSLVVTVSALKSLVRETGQRRCHDAILTSYCCWWWWWWRHRLTSCSYSIRWTWPETMTPSVSRR